MANELPSSVRQLLDRVAAGAIAPEAAERDLRRLSVRDLADATIDLERHARRGRSEAIFGEGKSSAQVLAASRALIEGGQSVIVTRLPIKEAKDVQAGLMDISGLTSFYHERPRVLTAGMVPAPRRKGMVAILAAGTTDLSVAEEALVTADALGSPVTMVRDVGVAGMHRLLRHVEVLRTARVIIVTAGMDGALPSVVAGLTAAPVIAVPTSVGYGACFHGLAPLLAMLNSCSPGVSVVNIDNGYGAGYLADVLNSMCESQPGD